MDMKTEHYAKSEPFGIYVHVPFCLSKCPYCDFYSVPYQEQTVLQYCKAAQRAIACAPQAGRRADSVYFGGGTPVLLGEHLSKLLQAIRERYTLTEDCEITLEANPAAMTLETLIKLRKSGFNRISMGVQSASDKELSYLGRRHSFAQALESVQLAKAAGFENISVDLMLGTPEQNRRSVDRFITAFFEEGVQHISGYLLKIEPGTPFAKQQIEKICPDEDTDADLYLYTVEQMNRHGYFQYEVSNFAKPGFESKHNLKYWRCQEYLGIGPAAHSFLGSERFYFPRDLQRFLSEENVWDLAERDGAGGDWFEYLMLRMRLREGIGLTDFSNRFKVDTAALLQKAKQLEKHGLTKITGDRISLTPNGFLISNSVIVELAEQVES